MKPRICIFTICWNEAQMMPYFLRHYATFADKIVVWDEHSTDGTRELVKVCPVAELRDWPFVGLDDNRFRDAVNEWYKEARGSFDWVMWPDVDELLWHPGMVAMLTESTADALQATGYGMIATGGPTTSGQIYEEIDSGVRQENYDKYIVWRPEVDIVHDYGRHTYPPNIPKCSGVKAAVPDLKLLHYHYFGIVHTAARNRRNFSRARDKKFAWNYAAGHNDNPNQVGSVAWVQRALEQNMLVKVVP